MILPPPLYFSRESFWRARWLTVCVAGVAFVASAQSDSMDTFSGDPDKNSFLWIPSDTPDWTRHFHIGAIVGLNISANFTTSGQFNLNAGAGNYDDGYVHPGNNAFGQTGNWGYNDPSQYHPTGGKNGTGSLDMISTTSYTTSGSSRQDGGPFPGFDMVYGDNLWYWKHARVGWELGFSLLPVNIQDNSPMSPTVNQTTYTFDTGGIVMPQAPFHGNSGGMGPTISDTPEPNSSQTFSQGNITGTQQLDLMVYALRLGPSFYWDLNEYLGFSLGAGPAVGLVSGNYKFDEIVSVPANGTSVHNSGEFSATKITYGGYVNGTLLYHIINDADFYLSAQYMPMGSTTFSDAGREGKLNLGGQVYVSLGINWPF
jgi:hypothetical protein